MANRPPISAGEWYHCFNRGVDKRLVFQNEDDCERFLVLLYISNDEDSNSCLADLELHHVTFEKVLARGVVRGTPLVDIGAYAFMPNHVHMIIIIVGARFSRPTLGNIIAYFKYQSNTNSPYELSLMYMGAAPMRR